MPPSTLKLALAALLIPRPLLALQVAPNSPCAPVCMDRESSDPSDPKSSNTYPSDIVCKDDDYTRTAAGVKWKKCMSCLETSPHVQGQESDQAWFLYNLRYHFNYCVYGYPNNTAVGSNPCQTSRACGALTVALEDGGMDPEKSPEFGYCEADGGAVTGEFFPKCLTCVRSFRDQVVVNNGLVALQAGCLQRPAAGAVVHLNDTVFSTSPVGVLTNAAPDGSNSDGGTTSTPTTTIAVAAISAVLGAAAVAAMIYVCVRRRRAERRREAAEHNGYGGAHRPTSSLSFRCQTHVPRLSPGHFTAGGSPVYDGQGHFTAGGSPVHDGQGYFSPYADARSPHAQQRGFAPAPWRPDVSPVAEHANHQHFRFPGPAGPTMSEKAALGLFSLNTTSLPAAPPNAVTPTSATQLLSSASFATSPYVPADYMAAAGGGDSPGQQWGWGAPQPQGKSPKAGGGRSVTPSKKHREARGATVPTESQAIQMTFPGPPTGR